MEDAINLTPRRAMGALVLVVDADPMFGLMLEACLDFEGARVKSVGSVAEAREAVTPFITGVVIDRELPDGDGLVLLKLLARECPQVPVVVCATSEVAANASQTVFQPWPGARVARLGKGDLARITEFLGLEPEHSHLPEDRLLHISALDVERPGH